MDLINGTFNLVEALGTAKNIDVLRQNSEFVQGIRNLQNENWELQIKLKLSKKELEDLKDEIGKLKKTLILEQSMIFNPQDSAYYLEEGHHKGPFCMVCWEKDHIQATLVKFENKLFCNICNRTFKNEESRNAKLKPLYSGGSPIGY